MYPQGSRSAGGGQQPVQQLLPIGAQGAAQALGPLQSKADPPRVLLQGGSQFLRRGGKVLPLQQASQPVHQSGNRMYPSAIQPNRHLVSPSFLSPIIEGAGRLVKRRERACPLRQALSKKTVLT